MVRLYGSYPLVLLFLSTGVDPLGSSNHLDNRTNTNSPFRISAIGQLLYENETERQLENERERVCVCICLHIASFPTYNKISSSPESAAYNIPLNGLPPLCQTQPPVGGSAEKTFGERAAADKAWTGGWRHRFENGQRGRAEERRT